MSSGLGWEGRLLVKGFRVSFAFMVVEGLRALGLQG